MNTKTFSAKPNEFVRTWFVMDADGEVLGRLATRAATVLRGKHKPVYTPHADTGDFVIVINAEKVKLTGNKLDKKMYRRHSEYPGGLKEMPYRRLLETHPERAIERAVKGMLPHNTLGRKQLRKLKVYAGGTHPHESQKPTSLAVGGQIPVTVELAERPKAKPRKASPVTAPTAVADESPVTTKKKTAPRKAAAKAKAKAKPATRKSTARKSAPRRGTKKKED